MPHFAALVRRSKILLVFVLVAFLLSLLGVQVDLTNSDLGRHLVNGRELLAGHWEVLYHNYYSYTHPEFAFVNHHWGSGVVFYALSLLGSIEAVRWGYVALMGITYFILYAWLAHRFGFAGVFVAVGLVVPLLVTRAEIRPEGFSYFFVVLYITYLERLRHKSSVSWRSFLPLAFVQILWVNLHVYFILGIGLFGYYALSYSSIFPFVRFRSAHHLAGLIMLVLASCISPFGAGSLLFPFLIFKEYGYEIVENKSLMFLLSWGMRNQQYFHLIFVDALVAVSGLIFIRSRYRHLIFYWALAAMFCVWATFAVRNTALAGMFASVWFAVFFHKVMAPSLSQALRTSQVMVSILLMLIVFVGSLFAYGQWYGALIENNLKAPSVQQDQVRGEFISSHVRGPIFNNYDIGSYLVYLLYPRERVYVDNRPEAFPVSFFTDEYKQMNDPKVFAALYEKYNFSAVVFQHRDLTPWAQGFLRNIVNDESWVPVYVDGRVVVLLQDNEQNKQVIEDFAIPREAFRFN